MLPLEALTEEPAPAASELRFSPRYLVQLPILFSGDLVHGKGTVVNLSRSGCGLRTSKRINRGLYLHLLLRLPSERVPLKVELAAVRWSNNSTCGVEFIRMSVQQQKRLVEFLDYLGMSPGSS